MIPEILGSLIAILVPETSATCPPQVNTQLNSLYDWHIQRNLKSYEDPDIDREPREELILSQQDRFTPSLFQLLYQGLKRKQGPDGWIDFDVFSNSQVNTVAAKVVGCSDVERNKILAAVDVSVSLHPERSPGPPSRLLYEMKKDKAGSWLINNITYLTNDDLTPLRGFQLKSFLQELKNPSWREYCPPVIKKSISKIYSRKSPNNLMWWDTGSKFSERIKNLEEIFDEYLYGKYVKSLKYRGTRNTTFLPLVWSNSYHAKTVISLLGCKRIEPGALSSDAGQSLSLTHLDRQYLAGLTPEERSKFLSEFSELVANRKKEKQFLAFVQLRGKFMQDKKPRFTSENVAIRFRRDSSTGNYKIIDVLPLHLDDLTDSAKDPFSIPWSNNVGGFQRRSMRSRLNHIYDHTNFNNRSRYGTSLFKLTRDI